MHLDPGLSFSMSSYLLAYSDGLVGCLVRLRVNEARGKNSSLISLGQRRTRSSDTYNVMGLS